MQSIGGKMIRIKELKKSEDLIGFNIYGHAEYAIKDDIVCAAVTVLTINTINSLLQITTSTLDECEIS